MREYKHLLSESAIWSTVSEFVDAQGNISRGEGQSTIEVTGEQITNDSWIDPPNGRMENKYNIRKISDTRYLYTSQNPALGIQEGYFDVNKDYVFSKFRIENTNLNGYEVIRRVDDTCQTSGALYDGNTLVNTWTATMSKMKKG